ncbi:CLC_0170 family protein [Paenibacillus sp. FSL M8-0142]|uniref:CLC_0170 family protein n=1 Tax=Paenibacillus sp. FSL M8-0142 TaxID=2954525 RepID=UPI00315A938E
MIGEIYSGYLYVAIAIWILTGLFNLVVDTRKYDQSKMDKEKKVSRVLEWINIVSGIVIFLGAMTLKIIL